MSAKIYYNGIDLCSGQPTPLLTRSNNPRRFDDDRRFAATEAYSLVGQLTGCAFYDITGAQAQLERNLFKPIGDLRFSDTSGYEFILSGVRIDGITYDQSPMVGILNYTIGVTHYPQNYFETVGILDKTNEWDVDVDEKNNAVFTHNITAKGVNTGPNYDNAFANAKNFVLTQTGFLPFARFPYFSMSFTSGSLDTRSESINRLDGTYGITETFLASTGSKVKKEYSVDISSGTDGIITISVGGTFSIGKSEPFQPLRDEYALFSAYNEASGAYLAYRGVTGLLPRYLSSGITESQETNSLQFNIAFNDWPTTNYKHDYTVTCASGADAVVSTSINGTIQGLGKRAVRYQNALNFFNTLDPYAFIQSTYTGFVGGTLPGLWIYPNESGRSNNEFDGIIEYNMSFNDKRPVLECSGIRSFDVSISTTYPIAALQSDIVPYGSGNPYVQDLDYATQGKISVQGEIVCLSGYDPVAIGKQYVNGKFMGDFLISKSNIVLESARFAKNDKKNSCSLTVAYVYDSSSVVNNYSGVSL